MRKPAGQDEAESVGSTRIRESRARRLRDNSRSASAQHTSSVHDNQVMNLRLRLLIATLLFMPLVCHADQELKIGFVNAPQILQRAPQAKAADEALRQEFGARETEINNVKKRLDGLRARLDRDGDTMSATERTRMERDIVATRRDLERSREDLRDDFNLRRNQELAKIQKLVQDAIRRLAKEKNFDLIVSDGVVWASERVNITDDVLEALAKQ